MHKAKSIGWIFLELHCPQIVKVSFREKHISSFLVTWCSVAKPATSALIFRISICGFGNILSWHSTIDLCKKKSVSSLRYTRLPPSGGIAPCWAEKWVILCEFFVQKRFDKLIRGFASCFILSWAIALNFCVTVIKKAWRIQSTDWGRWKKNRVVLPLTESGVRVIWNTKRKRDF